MLAHLDVGDDVLRGAHRTGVFRSPGHDRARPGRKWAGVPRLGGPEVLIRGAPAGELLVDRARVVGVAAVERVVDDAGHVVHLSRARSGGRAGSRGPTS